MQVADYQRTRQAIQAAEQITFGSSGSGSGGDRGSSDAGQRSRAASEVSAAAIDELETDFTSQWRRCISDAVIGLVVHHVMRIRRFSKSGDDQQVLGLRAWGNVWELLL